MAIGKGRLYLLTPGHPHVFRANSHGIATKSSRRLGRPDTSAGFGGCCARAGTRARLRRDGALAFAPQDGQCLQSASDTTATTGKNLHVENSLFFHCFAAFFSFLNTTAGCMSPTLSTTRSVFRTSGRDSCPPRSQARV